MTDSFRKSLIKLSTETLKMLVSDTRTQVDLGLMSEKEAHDRINSISAVLMVKELESQGISLE